MSGSAVLEDLKSHQNLNQDREVNEGSGVSASHREDFQRELQEFRELDCHATERIIDGMRTKFIRSYEQLYRVIEMLQDDTEGDVRLRYPKSNNKASQHKEIEDFVHSLQGLSIGEMLEAIDAKVREKGLRTELAGAYDLTRDDTRESQLTELHDLRRYSPDRFAWLEKSEARIEKALAQGRHLAFWVAEDSAAGVCDCLGKALDKIAAVDSQKINPLVQKTLQIWQGDGELSGNPQIESFDVARTRLSTTRSKERESQLPQKEKKAEKLPKAVEPQVDTLVGIKPESKPIKPKITVESRLPEEVLARFNVKPAIVTEIFPSRRGGQALDAQGIRYFFSLRDHFQYTVDGDGKEANVNGNADRIPQPEKDSLVLISNDTPTVAPRNHPRGKSLPEIRRYFVEEDLLRQLKAPTVSRNGAAHHNGDARPKASMYGSPTKAKEVEKPQVKPVVNLQDMYRPWENDDYETVIRSALQNSRDVDAQREFVTRLEAELGELNDQHVSRTDAEIANLEQSFKEQRLEIQAQQTSINEEIAREKDLFAESQEKERLNQLHAQREALKEQKDTLEKTRKETIAARREFFKKEWMEQFEAPWILLNSLKKEYLPAE